MLITRDNAKEVDDSCEPKTAYCIMLVDTFPRLAEQLAGILNDASARIGSTPHWKRALELSAAGKVDLIICDIELPDDGASKMLREVKSNHPNLLHSILFTRNIVTRPETDFLDPAEKRELLDKPFKNDQVIKVLTRRLTRLRNRGNAY